MTHKSANLLIMLKLWIACCLVYNVAASYAGFPWGAPSSSSSHSPYNQQEAAAYQEPQATECIYYDVNTRTQKTVQPGNYLTGEVLSDCTKLYCDENANTIYKKVEGCIDGLHCHLKGEQWSAPCGFFTCVSDGNKQFTQNGCLENGVCYKDGAEWGTGCSMKRCVQGNGIFQTTYLSEHAEGDKWAEYISGACLLYSCQLDDATETLKKVEIPGCYFPRGETCKTVKERSCGKLNCKFDEDQGIETFIYQQDAGCRR